MSTMARLLRQVWRGEVPAGILRDYLMEEASREEHFGRYLDRLWARYVSHLGGFYMDPNDLRVRARERLGHRFHQALEACPRIEEWIPF